MSDNLRTAARIAASVVGILIIVVLGYLAYDRLPEPPPTAAIPTRTAIPASLTPAPQGELSLPPVTTTEPKACVDDMRLVEHLTYDPQDPVAPHPLRPNRRFTKSWRIQNTGSCLWDPGYSLVYVSGNHPAAHMNGAIAITHGRTSPSETYDVAVKLISPVAPGLYEGYWRMRNASGTYFGDCLPFAISVVVHVPTVEPTWTPHPQTTIYFRLDRDRIIAGECAVLSWGVCDAQAVYFYREGLAWQDHEVLCTGQSRECPGQTTAYQLRVVRPSDWVDTRRLVVHVVQPPEGPQIARFTAEPPHVPEGGCVALRWEVKGQDTHVRVLRDGEVRWDGAPSIGKLPDCPEGTGQSVYLVQVTGPGGTTSMKRVVHVGLVAASTPALLSGTSWQVLAIGNSATVGPPMTVLFGYQNGDGQGIASGWGSCNTYSTPYQQTGALLTIGPSTVGDNACTEGLAAQERALLDALQAAASLRQGNGQLSLWNSAGEIVLNLAATRATEP